MLLSTPSPMSEDSVSNGGGNGNHNNNLNNSNNNTSFNDEDYNLMNNNNNNNNNQFNNNNTFFSNNHISSSSSLNVYPPTAVLKSTLYGKINQQRAGFPVCYNVQTAKVTLKLFLKQQQNTTNTNNNNGQQQPIFNMLQNRVYQYNEIDKLITKLAKNEIAIFGFVVFCENATKKREVLTNIDTYYSQSVNSQEYSINVAIGTYGKKCSSDLVKHCSFIVAYRMDQDQFQKQISTSRDSIHDYVPHYNNNTTFDKVFVQEIRFGFRKKSGREKLPLIKEPILCDVTKPIEYFDCLQNQNLLKVDDLLYSCYQPITRFVTSVQEAADSVVTTTQTFMESLSQKDIKSLIQQDLLINNYGNTNFGNNETMSTSTTSTTSNLGNLPVHLPVSLNNPTTISGNINNLLNNNNNQNNNNNTLQQQHSILNHPILLNNTTNTTNNNLNFLQQQNTTTMNNTSPLTSNNTTSNNNNTTTTNHTTSLQQQQQQSTTLVENDDDQFDFFILNKTIENLSKSNIERWSTKNNEMSFHEHPSYIAVLLGLIYARGTFSIIENNKHRNNDPQTNPPQIPIHIDALDFLLIKYYGTVTIGTMMGNIQINLKDIFIRNEFETLFFYLQVKELLPNFIAGIYLYSLLYYTKSLNQYNQQQLKNQSTLQNTLQNTLQQTLQEKELMKHYVQDIRAIYLQMSQNYYFEDFKMNLDIGDVLVKENLLSNEFINLAFNKLKLYAVKIGKYYYKLLNECDNLQNGGLLNNGLQNGLQNSLQNSLQNFNKQERLEMVINVLSNSFLRMNMSQQLSTLQQTSQQTNNNNGLNNLQNNLQQNNLQNNLGLSSSFSSSSLQFLNQSLTNDPTLQQASQSQSQSQQEENKRRRDFEYSGTSSFTGSDFIAHTKQKRSFAQQKYEDQKVKVLEQERNVMIMQTLLFNASTEGQEVIQTLYELEMKRLEIEKEFEEKLKLLAEKELLRDLL